MTRVPELFEANWTLEPVCVAMSHSMVIETVSPREALVTFATFEGLFTWKLFHITSGD